MSRKNNVNPDYYKIAGRDRPNEDIPLERGAPAPGARRAGQGKARSLAPNFIPGASPVEESATRPVRPQARRRKAV